MISGDLCYVEKERLGELRGEIGDFETYWSKTLFRKRIAT